MDEREIKETKSYCNTCKQETTFVKTIRKGRPGHLTNVYYKCLGCGHEMRVHQYREPR
jgi:hypothetical protein